MRQLTYTQAATCGKNLKARVTPEQSEKMQREWFAAGKTWAYGGAEPVYSNDPFMYLYSDNELCVGDYKNEFTDSKAEEIELIDLPQHDFASQQEVWAWLGQGKNQVKGVKSGDIHGFHGRYGMFNFTKDDLSDLLFDDYKNWKKHTPPRLIRVNGVEVPAPLEKLEGESIVFIPSFICKDKFEVIDLSLVSDEFGEKLIADKVCYATAEDAIKRAEAMIKFEVVE
jgi:hypothetical protein